MRPYAINLINSLVLISLGLWGYLSYPNASVTALIPVFTGIVLIVFTPGLKKENKLAAHVVVALTFILFIALYMPLKGAIGRNSLPGIIRTSTMLFFALVALIIYLKSFRDARKGSAKS